LLLPQVKAGDGVVVNFTEAPAVPVGPSDRPATVDDQQRRAPLHAVDQRAELVFQLGNTGLLRLATMAISDDARHHDLLHGEHAAAVAACRAAFPAKNRRMAGSRHPAMRDALWVYTAIRHSGLRNDHKKPNRDPL